MTYLFYAFIYVSTFTHFLISTPSLCTLHVCISLITASVGWYTVCIWVFVCVCCAAPDKLTSPPPFTGLGALQCLIPFPFNKEPITRAFCLGVPSCSVNIFQFSSITKKIFKKFILFFFFFFLFFFF